MIANSIEPSVGEMSHQVVILAALQGKISIEPKLIAITSSRLKQIFACAQSYLKNSSNTTHI